MPDECVLIARSRICCVQCNHQFFGVVLQIGYASLSCCGVICAHEQGLGFNLTWGVQSGGRLAEHNVETWTLGARTATDAIAEFLPSATAGPAIELCRPLHSSAGPIQQQRGMMT